MFEHSPQSLLGIDISSSVVKILELGFKKNQYRVASYAVEPLIIGAVVDGKIEDKEAVSIAIRRAVKRSGSKTKYAAVAVPASLIITKIISCPSSLTESEMEEQVLFEAENFIPYPMDEVRLDFDVVGPSKQDENAVDVVLVASRRENIDIRVDVLEMAGLKPKLIDIEACTIERAYPLLSPQLSLLEDEKVVAIVEIGATITTLYILVAGKIVFTREQAFGGRMLTENIGQHYGIPFQEAEQAKKEHILPEDYDAEVLEPFKSLMAMTITRALQFFFSTSTKYQSIDHIFLSGGCASIPDVVAMIEENTDAKTSIANPFLDMTPGSKLSLLALNLDAPSLLIACGLALRNFD